MRRFLVLALVAAPITLPGQLSFKADGTGATTRSIAKKLGDTVSVKDFGAVGDGVADDRAAVQAAMNTAGRVYFPAGTYLVGSAITIPASTVLQGAGRTASTIKRGFTGDFITSMGGSAALYDLTIDGNTATWGAGKGILIAASNGNQTVVNVTIKNFVEPCVEFAADGGSEFSSFGSTYYTTGTVGTVAAVKVNGTDTQAIPRKFYGTASDGCTLFDIGGSDHFWASGFYTNGMIFGSASFSAGINNARFGALGGTITLQGASHDVHGISAVAWDVKATSTTIDVQTPSWAITESGSAANNTLNIVNPSWTTTWTATVTNPTLGNGTLTSRWSRSGSWTRIEVDLTIGSTTTVGSGTYEFSIPQADISTGAVQVCGPALINNSGGTAGNLGVVRVQQGGTKVRIYYQNAAAVAFVTQAAPIAWANGDTLRFSCEYRVP